MLGEKRKSSENKGVACHVYELKLLYMKAYERINHVTTKSQPSLE